jgi:hypothetical protein
MKTQHYCPKVKLRDSASSAFLHLPQSSSIPSNSNTTILEADSLVLQIIPTLKVVFFSAVSGDNYNNQQTP